MKPEYQRHPNIRSVNTRRDLYAVADLIETCFNSQMDAEGRAYIRQIRRMAERAQAPFGTGLMGESQMPLRGLVWEQDGKVVANLTLLPFLKELKPVYLIANVAVHPDYRQRGIGRELTRGAIEHVRSLGATAVWLHVRHDNPVALHLYQSLGFVERARRTTWQLDGVHGTAFPAQPELRPSSRRAADWPQQLAWLKQAYPPQVNWNLTFNPTTLSPHPFRALVRWFNGQEIHQWAARQGNNLLGVLAYEPTHAYADWLWLACDPQREAEALGCLLPAARLAQRARPLTINYPAGRAVDVLAENLFVIHHTLIWMEYPL